jgi:hypothetical protein
MLVLTRRRLLPSLTLGVAAALGACGADAPDSLPPEKSDGAGDGGVGTLALNDVSILFPLPATEEARRHHLWLVPPDGAEGPYFPAELIPELPKLIADVPAQVGYPSAAVVALRFDPCFLEPGSDECQAQIRLVAQPAFVFNGPALMEDTAVHLFYELDGAAAMEVVDELLALKALSPVSTDGPLGVHPALVAEGLDGEFGRALRRLVVDHCREDNLVRITVNTFAFDNWGFLAFDFDGGELAPRQLVGLAEPSTSQSWIRQAQGDDLDDPSGLILPAPAEGFTYFLSAANWGDDGPLDPEAAAEAAAALLRLENPRARSTEEADCVSCHLATQARLFAEPRGVVFDGPDLYIPPPGLDTTLIIEPEIQGSLGNTISFGWHLNRFGSDQVVMPSISQRVINESAEVIRHLRAAPPN